MRTSYIKKMLLAAFPLTLVNVACQNEEMVETDHIIDGQTILRANMDVYDLSETRAQVDLGNINKNQELFMWNNEDCFTLYNADDPNVSSLFTIAGYDEENPSTSASFVGDSEFMDGTNVTAVQVYGAGWRKDNPTLTVGDAEAQNIESIPETTAEDYIAGCKTYTFNLTEGTNSIAFAATKRVMISKLTFITK